LGFGQTLFLCPGSPKNPLRQGSPLEAFDPGDEDGDDANDDAQKRRHQDEFQFFPPLRLGVAGEKFFHDGAADGTVPFRVPAKSRSAGNIHLPLFARGGIVLVFCVCGKTHSSLAIRQQIGARKSIHELKMFAAYS
jgi:hypothetical protein